MKNVVQHFISNAGTFVGNYESTSTKGKRSSYSAVAVMFLLATCFYTSASTAQDNNILTPNANLMWLSGDVNVSVFDDGDYESFLGSSEVWSDKWGVRAELFENDANEVFGMPKDSSYFNLDVKRRLLGSQDKSNLELGLGWQQMDIESQLDAQGPKVSLSGRYNLFDSIQVYGATSYFPELEDEILQTDMKAYEFEAGLLYKPLPSLSLKAGYRVFSLDLDKPSIVEELGSSSGFLLGTDLSW